MNIDIYLRDGLFVDAKNMPISGEPFLTVDTVCTVTLGMFASASATAIESIDPHNRWECIINDAYGAGNTAKIRVSAVTITDGKAVITFDPLGSAELRESLGDLPAKRYTFELNGFAESTDPDFTLQFPVIIRNRVGTGAADPEPAAGYIVYPDGGSVGQVLTKTATGAEWADGGGGGGGAVSSVNGKTGAVVLDAADVGAIADPAEGTAGQILRKTADGAEWSDEAGAVLSVNGKTGAVTLDASDVGAVESPGAAGAIGQVLTKTADGTGWRDVEAYMPGVTLAPCSGLGLAQTGTGPAFSWTDPDNVILNGATLAVWNRTVLVRKVGAYPANWQDGTIMAETSAALGNKNYYRDHSYTDETQEEGSTYYYKLFSATTAGDWNDLTANEYTSGLGMSWGQVQQYVRAGRGPDLFPVGTVFIVNHAEYVHPNGDGLYFRVVGHDQVPARNEALEHTMCLEMVDCLFSAPYDAAELEYALTWDTTAKAGKTYYIQSGGSWVQLVLGTDYDIGDPVPAAEWYEKNLTGRSSQGSNNPVQNNVLQWLNSTGAANNWFEQQTIWDLNSTTLGGKSGFLRHIAPDFLAVVTEAKLTRALSGVDGNGSSVTFPARFWLPSYTQVFGGANHGITEGAMFQYYSSSGSKTKKNMEGTACGWWLGSPYADQVYYTPTYAVTVSGTSGWPYSNTDNFYISPACIIG